MARLKENMQERQAVSVRLTKASVQALKLESDRHGITMSAYLGQLWEAKRQTLGTSQSL